MFRKFCAEKSRNSVAASSPSSASTARLPGGRAGRARRRAWCRHPRVWGHAHTGWHGTRAPPSPRPSSGAHVLRSSSAGCSLPHPPELHGQVGGEVDCGPPLAAGSPLALRRPQRALQWRVRHANPAAAREGRLPAAGAKGGRERQAVAAAAVGGGCVCQPGDRRPLCARSMPAQAAGDCPEAWSGLAVKGRVARRLSSP